MALVEKVHGERPPPSSAYACNYMDDTWSIVFDTTTTMNSALNELLNYFKRLVDVILGIMEEIMISCVMI